jgi:beta-lactamase regulating signal transducer with metallopeptidase domain
MIDYDLMLSVLVDASLKATAILVIAAAATVALRRASSALRHALWLAAVCGSLALPALALALPAWSVPLAWGSTPPAAPEPTSEVLVLPALVAEADAQPATPVVPVEQAAPSVARPWRVDWRLMAVVVWLLGALLVTLRTVGALWRVRAIARRAERAGGAWNAAGCVAAAQLGLERPAALLVSDRVATPATLGFLKPVVLLPSCAASWPSERRVAALLHEFAHVQRRDCATQLAAQFACAVYWFNPMMWMAARALREEREHAADDRVLGAGVRASDYAGLLLDVAQAAPPSLPLPAASFADARHGQLERRLQSILDPRQPRRPSGRAAAMLAMLVATCVVAPLAAARPPVVEPTEVSTAAQDPADEAAEQKKQAEQAEQGEQAEQTGSPRQKQKREAEEELRRERGMTPSPTPTPTPMPFSHGGEDDEMERKLEAERQAVAAQAGDEDDPVVSALREALNDKDKDVRKQAAWALEMIAMKRGKLRVHPEGARPRGRVHRVPAPEAVVPEEDPDPQQR